MKKLVRYAIALAVVVALHLAPASRAGEIDIGGFCGSQACVQNNPAPFGYYWNQEGDVWHLHRDQ